MTPVELGTLYKDSDIASSREYSWTGKKARSGSGAVGGHQHFVAGTRITKVEASPPDDSNLRYSRYLNAHIFTYSGSQGRIGLSALHSHHNPAPYDFR